MKSQEGCWKPTFPDIVAFTIHPLDNLGADAGNVVENEAVGYRRQFEKAWTQVFWCYDTIGGKHKFIGLLESIKPMPGNVS